MLKIVIVNPIELTIFNVVLLFRTGMYLATNDKNRGESSITITPRNTEKESTYMRRKCSYHETIRHIDSDL